MKYEYDENKSQLNKIKRGFGFELAGHLEWDYAAGFVDDRKEYGELRIRALAPIGDRLYSLTYTMRGKACRVISLRKASKKELKEYEKA